ncbi:hypothetical protein K523DRAFT_418563 [Schizophyllum commune Tattone D]|nr:hypothetical protein K523DRAFT_418563 [Schizophyllum commune Tattone D]
MVPSGLPFATLLARTSDVDIRARAEQSRSSTSLVPPKTPNARSRSPSMDAAGPSSSAPKGSSPCLAPPKESSPSWWASTKQKLSPTKEREKAPWATPPSKDRAKEKEREKHLSPAQRVIEEARAREREEERMRALEESRALEDARARDMAMLRAQARDREDSSSSGATDGGYTSAASALTRSASAATRSASTVTGSPSTHAPSTSEQPVKLLARKPVPPMSPTSPSPAIPTRHPAPARPKSFTTAPNLDLRRSSANLTDTAPLNLGRKEGEGPSRGSARVAFSGVDTHIGQGNTPDTHHRRASSPGAHPSRPSVDVHYRQLSHDGHPRQASTASDTSSGSSFTTAVADLAALRVMNASEGRTGEGSDGQAEVKSGSHPTRPVVDPSASNPFNASSTSLPPETARRLPTTPSRAAGTRTHQVEGGDGTNGRAPIRDTTAAHGVPPAQGPPHPDTPSAGNPPPTHDVPLRERKDSNAPTALPSTVKFSPAGALDVPATVLEVARRLEKLENWTVKHVHALEERMGSVERRLVRDKVAELKESEQAKNTSDELTNKESKSSPDSEIKSSANLAMPRNDKSVDPDAFSPSTGKLDDKTTESELSSIRAELGELQTRVGDLGRDMAVVAREMVREEVKKAMEDAPGASEPPRDQDAQAVADIQRDMQEVRRELQDIRSEVAKTSQDVEDVREDVNGLRRTSSGLSREVEGVSRAAANLERRVEDLAREMEHLSRDVVRGELERQVSEVRGDVQNVSRDVFSARGDVQNTTRDVQSVRGDVHDVRRDVQSVSRDVQDLRRDVQDVRREMARLASPPHDSSTRPTVVLASAERASMEGKRNTDPPEEAGLYTGRSWRQRSLPTADRQATAKVLEGMDDTFRSRIATLEKAHEAVPARKTSPPSVDTSASRSDGVAEAGPSASPTAQAFASVSEGVTPVEVASVPSTNSSSPPYTDAVPSSTARTTSPPSPASTSVSFSTALETSTDPIERDEPTPSPTAPFSPSLALGRSSTLTPVRRAPSVTARESTSPPMRSVAGTWSSGSGSNGTRSVGGTWSASRAGSSGTRQTFGGGTRLPYPTGDYADDASDRSPRGSLTSPPRDQSLSTRTSEAAGASDSSTSTRTRARPLSAAALKPTPSMTGLPSTSLSDSASTSVSGLPSSSYASSVSRATDPRGNDPSSSSLSYVAGDDAGTGHDEAVSSSTDGARSAASSTRTPSVDSRTQRNSAPPSSNTRTAYNPYTPPRAPLARSSPILSPLKRYTVALGEPITGRRAEERHEEEDDEDDEEQYVTPMQSPTPAARASRSQYSSTGSRLALETAVFSSAPDESDPSSSPRGTEDPTPGVDEDAGERADWVFGSNRTTRTDDATATEPPLSRARSMYSAPRAPSRSRSIERGRVFGTSSSSTATTPVSSTPTTPTADRSTRTSQFIDPYVLRRQEREGTSKVAMPRPIAKVPINQLVAFFDGERR